VIAIFVGKRSKQLQNLLLYNLTKVSTFWEMAWCYTAHKPQQTICMLMEPSCQRWSWVDSQTMGVHREIKCFRPSLSFLSIYFLCCIFVETFSCPKLHSMTIVYFQSLMITHMLGSNIEQTHSTIDFEMITTRQKSCMTNHTGPSRLSVIPELLKKRHDNSR